MSIKTLNEKKRQQILLIVGAGILLVAVVILYFGVWKKAPAEIILEQELEQNKIANLVLEEKLKKIDLDFTFLTEIILPFLKSHGELPVKIIESGRSNPFISY